MSRKQISKLRELRNKAGMSAYDLALILKMTPARVIQYETESEIPTKRLRWWIKNWNMPDWLRQFAREELKGRVEVLRNTADELERISQ
jgi:transcriptional regulator with XRE-family HTH domain